MHGYIEHFGTQTKSGRYPWGSGARPYQRLEKWGGNILAAVDELHGQRGMSNYDMALELDIPYREFMAMRQAAKLQPWGGDLLKAVADLQGIQKMSNAQAAAALDMTTRELIARKQAAKVEKRAQDAPRAIALRDAGHSYQAIADMMGYKNESSIRALLEPSENQRKNILQNTYDVLKRRVDERTYVDVGRGNEIYLGVSKERLEAAVQMLVDEGYHLYGLEQRQLTNPGKYTPIKVLCKPEINFAGDDTSLVRNKDKIAIVAGEYSNDGGETFFGIEPPAVIDRSRVLIRYAEDGGADRDGTIELRDGVPDLTLNGATYAQVRISVGDGDSFMKGMAYYSGADMPPGVDIIYNSNKKKGTPDTGPGGVFKDIKSDPENPYGSDIKQFKYTDTNGNEQLSALNLVNVEGSWDKWAKTFSSQLLGKQSLSIAETQLNLDKDRRLKDLAEIQELTNPQVQKKLLLDFASECDSASWNLKAAALADTKNKVLLPAPDLKPNEVYAPHLDNGTRVALVRHPHAGPFEIPELIVNNNNKKVIEQLGRNPLDAIGIHPSAAEKLSGADFDGDTVLVIPNNQGLIKSRGTLKGLENFEPKVMYKGYEGMKKFTDTQKEMGIITNLITDMTLQGATNDEIARAVRHSMVTIDAEKHNLDWNQSYIRNGIDALKKKYQPGANGAGGASTLLSRAKNEPHVERQVPRAARDGGPIDPETGKLVYTLANDPYVNSKGKLVTRTMQQKQMAAVDDARLLMSGPNHEGTPMERVYATYANTMKQLANDARKQALTLPRITQNKSATKAYAAEVASLDSSLRIAKMNAPRERLAQLNAGVVVANTIKNTPYTMPKKEVSKLNSMALNAARQRAGTVKRSFKISDREWEAIQAGALSASKLDDILNMADSKRLKELATPRYQPTMTPAKIARARSLLNSGRTLAEVAKALGVSVSTITNNV